MSRETQSFRAPLAVLLVATAIFGVFLYWRTQVEDVPGDYHVRQGNYRLEDAQFQDAVTEFERAIEQRPDHRDAHFGLAITYMQMGRLEDALAKLDQVAEIAPGFGAAYANRGIVHDRLGLYQEALADYRRALELEPELAEGPGWLWRFLRNISEKPPTIADRADYIEAELAKPPEERLLSLPEVDREQRMYKVK